MYPKLEETLKQYQAIEAQMADPTVMADGAKYSKLAKELGTLAKQAKPYLQLKNLVQEIATLQEDAAKETDPEMKQMLEEEITLKTQEKDTLQVKIEDMLLVDPGEDFDSIIVEIRAGTGGDEASLFASDLFNMYSRYAQEKGWKIETLDFSPTDAGGFKDISFNMSGEGVYRFMRYESGGHRVQRVPKTETQGRIHTSAATVAVLPEPTEVQIEIRPEDIETQTFSC
ncbi:MAG TPA: PCRF domain-containing protein, partial [Gemmatales bacterium]|nr:PCRF domain-containing protein [Gemmatales bacterium]